jgi:hypothetical protein
LVTNRFQGTCKKYLVDINNQSIEFWSITIDSFIYSPLLH